MTEFLVYIKIYRNNRILIDKMRLSAFIKRNKLRLNGEGGKLVYFEIKMNLRSAIAAENKFKSLTRKRLIEKIRNFNPEFLDLKQTIHNTNSLKELIY